MVVVYISVYIHIAICICIHMLITWSIIMTGGGSGGHCTYIVDSNIAYSNYMCIT